MSATAATAASVPNLLKAFEISKKAVEMATKKVMQYIETENRLFTLSDKLMDAAAATAKAAGYSEEETKDIIANAAANLVEISTGTKVYKLTSKEKIDAGLAILNDNYDAISAANLFLFDCEDEMKAAHAAFAAVAALQ